MKSETRKNFYHRLQQEYNLNRLRGYDRTMILEALSEKYGVSIASLRMHLDLRQVDHEAYSTFKLLPYENV